MFISYYKQPHRLYLTVMGTVTKRGGLLKALKITGITLASVAVLVVLLVCGATLWLTPERLTGIVNRELSKELEADVTAHNVRFTVWSSFPYLCVEVDSVHVASRTLQGVTNEERARLPENAGFLASTGHISGDINVLRLLGGKYDLGNVRVDSLTVNMVELNDSVNNYDIIPHEGKSTVPPFSIKFLKLRRPGRISYTGISNKANAEVSLAALDFRNAGERDLYTLRLNGDVDADAAGMVLLRDFPFVLGGRIRLGFRPFRVHTENYAVQLGGTRGKVSLEANLEGDMRLNSFQYHLNNLNPSDLLPFFPMLQDIYSSDIKADLTLDLTARLTTPYALDSDALPSLTVDFKMPEGAIVYAAKGQRKLAINSIDLSGTFNFNGADPADSYVEIPELHVKGEGTEIDGTVRVSQLTADPLIKAHLRGRSDLARISALIPTEDRMTITGTMQADTRVRALLSGLTDGSLRKLTVEGQLRFPELIVADRSKGLTASMRDATLRCSLDSMMQTTRIWLNSGPISCRYGSSTVRLSDLAAEFSARRNKSAVIAKPFAMPAAWNADARTLSFAAHTPHLLKVDAPAALTELMKDWRTFLSLKSSKGTVVAAGAGKPIRISNVDLRASFDSLHINSLSVRSEETAARFSGAVSNLRQFLSSKVAAPLKANVRLDLDTVQINQLARNYYHPAPDQTARNNALQPSDTVCMLIPRNVFADVHVSAMQTRYMNLHLYDLDTDIHVGNGKVNVDSLRISADFGHAKSAVRYDTSDMQDMSAACNVALLDVDVVRFFQNFHQLLVMMPQMKNLSGYVSAECNAGLLLFPNMYANVPSLHADIGVQGRDLQVHQNRFIRHIAKMLLLPKGILHIKDMDVRAEIGNNLIKLYPFSFDVSRYSLTMMGLNNLNGQIYYHIGVDKSPLRIPFGINIQGDFHNPRISFGGKRWKDRYGTEIAGGVMDYNAVNIIQEGRKYMHEFLSHAAAYQGD